MTEIIPKTLISANRCILSSNLNESSSREFLSINFFRLSLIFGRDAFNIHAHNTHNTHITLRNHFHNCNWHVSITIFRCFFFYPTYLFICIQKKWIWKIYWIMMWTSCHIRRRQFILRLCHLCSFNIRKSIENFGLADIMLTTLLNRGHRLSDCHLPEIALLR